MQNYDGQFKLNGQEYFYRAKDDSGSSKITRVNNEEHHYRMVEITNKETGNYDVMMISTGDSFTMFHRAAGWSFWQSAGHFTDVRLEKQR